MRAWYVTADRLPVVWDEAVVNGVAAVTIYRLPETVGANGSAMTVWALAGTVVTPYGLFVAQGEATTDPFPSSPILPPAYVTATDLTAAINAQAAIDSPRFVKAFAATASIVYDPITGAVTSETEDGVTTTYTYNPDGGVHTETRLGQVRTWSYNANGDAVGSTLSVTS